MRKIVSTNIQPRLLTAGQYGKLCLNLLFRVTGKNKHRQHLRLKLIDIGCLRQSHVAIKLLNGYLRGKELPMRGMGADGHARITNPFLRFRKPFVGNALDKTARNRSRLLATSLAQRLLLVFSDETKAAKQCWNVSSL